MKTNNLTIFALLALATATCSAHTKEIVTQQSLSKNSSQVTQTNGYTQILVDTSHEQKKPLDTVVTIQFPNNILNVGQSINYILQQSGYHLQDLSETCPETLNLYTIEIPLSHRQFYQSSVIQIIQTLAGEAYEVIINHITREIEITPIANN